MSEILSQEEIDALLEVVSEDNLNVIESPEISNESSPIIPIENISNMHDFSMYLNQLEINNELEKKYPLEALELVDYTNLDQNSKLYFLELIERGRLYYNADVIREFYSSFKFYRNTDVFKTFILKKKGEPFPIGFIAISDKYEFAPLIDKTINSIISLDGIYLHPKFREKFYSYKLWELFLKQEIFNNENLTDIFISLRYRNLLGISGRLQFKIYGKFLEKIGFEKILINDNRWTNKKFYKYNIKINKANTITPILKKRMLRN